MKKVSLERYYFVLYGGAITLKMAEMALNPFCDKTLHFISSSFEGEWFTAINVTRIVFFLDLFHL